MMVLLYMTYVTIALARRFNQIQTGRTVPLCTSPDIQVLSGYFLSTVASLSIRELHPRSLHFRTVDV